MNCQLLSLAVAADPAAPPILWGSLRAGMLKAEVKAAEPAKTIRLTDSCVELPTFAYQNGKLYKVTLSSGISEPEECATLVGKNLVEKYGAGPRRTTRYVRGDCGCCSSITRLCHAMGGDKLVRYLDVLWIKDGVRVTLETSDADNAWTVEYVADPQVSAGTLGKF